MAARTTASGAGTGLATNTSAIPGHGRVGGRFVRTARALVAHGVDIWTVGPRPPAPGPSAGPSPARQQAERLGGYAVPEQGGAGGGRADDNGPQAGEERAGAQDVVLVEETPGRRFVPAVPRVGRPRWARTLRPGGRPASMSRRWARPWGNNRWTPVQATTRSGGRIAATLPARSHEALRHPVERPPACAGRRPGRRSGRAPAKGHPPVSG